MPKMDDECVRDGPALGFGDVAVEVLFDNLEERHESGCESSIFSLIESPVRRRDALLRLTSTRM